MRALIIGREWRDSKRTSNFAGLQRWLPFLFNRFLNFLTMAKLVATSSTGAIRKRPRRRIGEISRDVQRELDRLTKFERADLLMRVSCKLLPSIDG